MNYKDNRNSGRPRGSGVSRVKLSFDDGFAERPFYVIKANTMEKGKGINMREIIKDNFNITDNDEREFFRKRLEEWNKDAMTPTEFPKEMSRDQIKLTRDEKGNLASPFRSKKKLLEEKS